MASDFWSSTHCNTWLLSLPTLERLVETSADHTKYHLPTNDILTLHIYFSSLIHKLARKISLRQSAIATACVYFKRFYSKNAFAETDPFLVLTACLYVAAKVEECPVHVKSVLSEARACLSEHSPRPLPTDYTKLAEMEFFLLNELEFDLVVYHPYTTLLSVCGREPLDDGYWSDDDLDNDDGDVDMEPFSESEEEDEDDDRPKELDEDTKTIIKRMKRREKKREVRREGETEQDWMNRVWGRGSGRGSWQVDDGVFQMAWFIINDSYKTHLSLLYPPYMIALSALYLAFSLEDKLSADSYRLRGRMLMPLRTGSEHPGDFPLYYIFKPRDQLPLDSPGLMGSGSTTTSIVPSPADTTPIRLLTRGNAPKFFASLDISFPLLLSIVQQLISLYPLWESFAPRRNPGLSGVAGASTPGNDPKAHLMAYRAAQALRRAQAMDKEREGREMVLSAREGTKAHLVMSGKTQGASNDSQHQTSTSGPQEKGPLIDDTTKREKRYPENPVRWPTQPCLTEERVPALLSTLWREFANRAEKEREQKRMA